MSVILYPCILCVALLMYLFVLGFRVCELFVLGFRVCELFGETILDKYGCYCYFVVEYYGSV